METNQPEDRIEMVSIGVPPNFNATTVGSMIFRVQNYDRYHLEILIYDGANKQTDKHKLPLEFPEYAISYAPDEGRIWIQSTNGPLNRSDFRFKAPSGRLDFWTPSETRRPVHDQLFSLMFFDSQGIAPGRLSGIELDEAIKICTENGCRVVAFQVVPN